MESNERTSLLSPLIQKNTGLCLIYAIICIVDVFGVFPIVALPYAIIKCGYYGIPLIITVSTIQIYTAILLCKSWLLMENLEPSIIAKRRYPYSALAEAAYGKKFAHFTTFVVNFGIFSASVPNLIVASQNLQLLGENVSNEIVKITYCHWIIIVGIVLCPFLWFGSPKDIKHLSTVSGVIVLSVFGLILFNILSIDDQQQPQKNSIFLDNVPVWKNLLSAYGMLTFQFDIHPSILNIHLDMKDKKLIKEALIGGYSVTILLFGITGIFAALFIKDKLQPSILESLKITTSLHVAAFLVAVQLATSSVIGNNSLYQQLEESLGISKDFSWHRCVVRTLLTLITVVVAVSVPRFDLVMSFVGGALTGPLAFIFPPLFYIKIIRKLGSSTQPSVIIMDPLTHKTVDKNLFGKETATIQKCDEGESFFCILIIVTGILMTGLSTYYNFVNNIQFSAFYPPCIYNFTNNLNFNVSTI